MFLFRLLVLIIWLVVVTYASYSLRSSRSSEGRRAGAGYCCKLMSKQISEGKWMLVQLRRTHDTPGLPPSCIAAAAVSLIRSSTHRRRCRRVARRGLKRWQEIKRPLDLSLWIVCERCVAALRGCRRTTRSWKGWTWHHEVRTGEGLQPLILGHTDKAQPASRLQIQVVKDKV